MAFNGFTPATIQFLKDLGDNNYKEWFEENRSVYESELLNPFKELIVAMSPAMYNIDSRFELRPHRVLSRIYRDTRFSKNKDPYKTCLWMTFQVPTEDWVNVPGFFMELNAETYIYGMGLFAPKKKIMDAVRDNIAYDAEEFEKQTRPLLENGFGFYGEEYKRRIPNELSDYFQPWIQRKDISLVKTQPITNDVFTPQFADIITKEYESLVWLYNFLKDDE